MDHEATTTGFVLKIHKKILRPFLIKKSILKKKKAKKEGITIEENKDDMHSDTDTDEEGNVPKPEHLLHHSHSKKDMNNSASHLTDQP